MENLRITKGGKLVETYLHYDEEKEEGEYRDRDVTSSAVSRMFEYCDLDDDVTLKDIFLLLNTELEIFDCIIRNWCKDIVTEGLTQPEKPYDISDETEAIEYLELYWHFEKNKHDETDERLHGLNFPDFHDIRVERQQNQYFDWKNKDGSPAVMHAKGERTNWGISFTPANELINIPVKLNRDAKVYRTDYTKRTSHGEIGDKDFNITWEEGADQDKVVAELRDIEYTLGHILYGIIWKMSFHGGPDKRDAAKDNLDRISDEVKEQYDKGEL